MGMIRALLGGLMFKRTGAAPYQKTSAIPPQENYAGYTQLPNLPMGSQGDYVPDPNRLHAPFNVVRENRYIVLPGQGKVQFDAGNGAVLRVPDQPLQQEFNQKKALPPVDVLVPGAGVVVPIAQYQTGWEQVFVPEPGVRPDIAAIGHPVRLSTPIQVKTLITEGGKRAPITGGRSPKVKRGGSSK